MKRFSTLTMLIGFGVFATGACDGDGADDTYPNTPKGGSAGHAGTASGVGGTSGRAGRAGRAGRGGSLASSGKGGSDATVAGRGGRGGNGAGASGRGGTGGGVIGGAGAGGEPDTGGAGGAPSCYGATARDWVDFTPHVDQGEYARYAASFESSAFPGQEALLELWVGLPDTGAFLLGTGDNANWATCQQCVIARVDEGSEPERVFFADGGMLTIDDASDPLNGVIDANLTNVHFAEVTLDDADPPQSHPVEGGSCLEGVTTHIQVPNEASGGAGGAGGQGGEGGYAGAYEQPEGCIEVTGGAWLSDVQPGFGRYVSLLSPNLGSPLEDAVIVGFFTNDVGTFRIGHGVDSRWSKCERCVLANIQDDSDGLWFYGVEGTLVVDSGSTPMSGILEATATDVTFMQVDPFDLETPVTNGECLHLATATISKP